MSIFRKSYILPVLAALTMVFGACSDELELDNGGGVVQPGRLLLSTQPTLTRANVNFEADGHAEDNEENIGRVTLFFFSDEASESKAFYVYETAVNKITTADLSIKISKDYLPYFAPGSTDDTRSAYVYALVNSPAELSVDADKSQVTYFEGGKEKTVDATIYNLRRVWVGEPGFINQIQPNDFFMRGGANILAREISGRWQAEGFIPLTRLAAKVRLFAKMPEKVYIDAYGSTIERDPDDDEATWEAKKASAAEIWEPAPGTDGGEMKLYFFNAATRGRVDGYVNGYNRTEQAFGNVDRDKKLQNVVRRISDDAELLPSDEDSEYNYSHSVPYYSYPNIWDSNLASEEYMTYVVVELPWHRLEKNGSGSGTYQVCYYQVPVNAVRAPSRDEDCLEPNTYYRIKIRLGTLGSKNFGDPLLLQGSYETVDWVKTDVDVNIKGKRYLIVNQTEWTVNNLHTLEIPFSTSHQTVVDECYVTYFRYNDIWGTEVKTDPNKKEYYHGKDEFKAWIALADKQLAAVGGKNGEGLVTMDPKEPVDGKRGDLLYYKKEYFYDQYYDQLEREGKLTAEERSIKDYNDYGFRYYVGHEHPITFDPDKVTRDINKITAGSDEDQAWNDYMLKYDNLNKVYSCTIDDNTSILTFKHPLVQWRPVRNSAGEIDRYEPLLNQYGRLWEEFSRIEITIKIRHKDYTADDGLFRETIRIIQYPGIYITVSHNYSDYNTNGSANRRYVMVNGTEVGSTNPEDFSYVNAITSYSNPNCNPNMYLIHTTQLSDDIGDIYRIGDPRTTYYNNYLSSKSPDEIINTDDRNSYLRDGRDLYLTDDRNRDYLEYIEQRVSLFGPYTYSRAWGQSTATNYYYGRDRTPVAVDSAFCVESTARRTLRTYYPTDERPGVRDDFIAPTFRIASSFGKITINGRIEMRRRCAAYQEAGRPAGRWRMPTKAEVKYIARLSADGKIPILFGFDQGDASSYGYYWCAQGLVKANAEGNVEDETFGDYNGIAPGLSAVRCVYDEWYWNEVDGGEFPQSPGIKINDALQTTFFWGDMIKR